MANKTLILAQLISSNDYKIDKNKYNISLSDFNDVDLNNLSNDQSLQYNSSTGKWEAQDLTITGGTDYTKTTLSTDRIVFSGNVPDTIEAGMLFVHNNQFYFAVDSDTSEEGVLNNSTINLEVS